MIVRHKILRVNLDFFFITFMILWIFINILLHLSHYFFIYFSLSAFIHPGKIRWAWVLFLSMPCFTIIQLDTCTAGSCLALPQSSTSGHWAAPLEHLAVKFVSWRYIIGQPEGMRRASYSITVNMPHGMCGNPKYIWHILTFISANIEWSGPHEVTSLALFIISRVYLFFLFFSENTSV